MRALELKVPPPVVTLMIGLVMWGLASGGEGGPERPQGRLVMALTIATVGLIIGAAGKVQFRMARTTANPLRPGSASSLVTAGIYRFTRNPMYVALLLVLIGWATFLGSWWALCGPLVLVLYLTRFQIQPEERILLAMFGEPYATYMSNVRRWL